VRSLKGRIIDLRNHCAAICREFAMSASQATTAAGSSKRNKKGKEKARCSRHPPPRKRLHCEKGPVSMVDYESETISRSRESLTFSYSIECDRQETFVHPSSTAGVRAGGRVRGESMRRRPAASTILFTAPECIFSSFLIMEFDTNLPQYRLS
jgi:hypothetical protein